MLLATPDVSPDQSSSDEDSSFSSTYSSDESDEPNVQADLSLVDSELEACAEASCSLPAYITKSNWRNRNVYFSGPECSNSYACEP